MSLTAPWAGRRTVQSAKDQSDLGRRWRPVLLAYFLRRVRNHAEAEDLTQELLAKLVSLDGSALDSPEAYIFQMASNLLADRARRFRVRTQFLEMVGRADGIGKIGRGSWRERGGQY